MPKYRKVGWGKADVRCPFYLTDNRDERTIRCEGYCTGSEVISRFRTLKGREEHMGRYCVGRYERCPLYRMTYCEKYADD